MDPTLKPCPICNKAVELTTCAISPTSQYPGIHPDLKIRCIPCTLVMTQHGPLFCPDGGASAERTRRQLIERWNTRSQPEPAAASLEAKTLDWLRDQFKRGAVIRATDTQKDVLVAGSPDDNRYYGNLTIRYPNTASTEASQLNQQIQETKKLSPYFREQLLLHLTQRILVDGDKDEVPLQTVLKVLGLTSACEYDARKHWPLYVARTAREAADIMMAEFNQPKEPSNEERH